MYLQIYLMCCLSSIFPVVCMVAVLSLRTPPLHGLHRFRCFHIFNLGAGLSAEEKGDCNRRKMAEKGARKSSQLIRRDRESDKLRKRHVSPSTPSTHLNTQPGYSRSSKHRKLKDLKNKLPQSPSVYADTIEHIVTDNIHTQKETKWHIKEFRSRTNSIKHQRTCERSQNRNRGEKKTAEEHSINDETN